jgi:hypothetical protein
MIEGRDGKKGVRDKEADWMKSKQKVKWGTVFNSYSNMVIESSCIGVSDYGQASWDKMRSIEMMGVNMIASQDNVEVGNNGVQIMVEGSGCGTINATVIARVGSSQDNYRRDWGCTFESIESSFVLGGFSNNLLNLHSIMNCPLSISKMIGVGAFKRFGKWLEFGPGGK